LHPIGSLVISPLDTFPDKKSPCRRFEACRPKSVAKNNRVGVHIQEIFMGNPNSLVFSRDKIADPVLVGGNAVKNVHVYRKQAGIILMEVLPFLTLLAIAGIVFVTYSSPGR